MIEGDGEELTTAPNGGPSWKWLAGIALSIIGVGMVALIAVIWNNLDTLQTKIDQQAISVAPDIAQIKEDIAMIKNAESSEAQDRAKLWERVSADHEMLIKHDYELSVNNDWISAHVHADKATREVHGR